MVVMTPEDGSEGLTEASVAFLEVWERCQAALHQLSEAMADGFEKLAEAEERFREVLRKEREGRSGAKPTP